ncbi:hypothetical protein BBP40_008096 [Aspergillus hancockii]|nr:hypothetical protein BBP40_008096 [Aspergillus hancockii]
MYLPSPTYTFTIPSLYDGTLLDGRLYLPRSLLQSQNIQGAIVAHPYAPLGGCYDDPVVGFAGGELLKAGYIVGTFNFRGAGNSEGKTSWTAKPELADYATFYGFMLCYLHLVRSRLASQRGDRSTTDNNGADAESTLGSAAIHLILGGYSYGSLIVSHLPALDVMVDLFKNSRDGTPSYEILRTAENVSTLLKANGPTQERLSATGALSWSLDISKIAVSYLLVSPLLPPLNFFLTLFSTMSLNVRVNTVGQRKQILCPKPASQLCAYPSLAIYGNQDTFTSANKLKRWSDELSHVPGSHFQSAEIDGAGHFWREDGVESQARDALREWLRLIP